MPSESFNSFLLLLTVFLLSVCPCFPVTTSCYAASWKVVEVREGDLLIVQAGGQTRKIRLYGVACPAKGQPFHRDARMLANFLSLHKNVDIIPIFSGSEGFTHALVRIDGTKYSLNERLVGYGLAWVRLPECRTTMCGEWKRLEELARSNAIGLWADPFAVAPWEWAKEKRMEVFRRSREASKALE